METVTIHASKPYPVFIGDGLLHQAAHYLQPVVGQGAVTVVADDKVFSLYGEALLAQLAANGNRADSFVFPNGEQSKTADTYFALLNFMAGHEMSRSDTVIALGGGVTGDLAGFAAATYMRGTRLVQMPTTLLAAVDSSVGGKTGVDLKAGKNLAGAFYQPDLVLCDYRLFDTLEDAVFTDGMGEVIKHAVLAGGELRDLLQFPLRQNLERLIFLNVSIKGAIIAADEREAGKRQLLNFGHTIGHAVETLSDYRLSHGQAVSIGACLMARICETLGICTKTVADEIVALYQRHGLPTETRFTARDIAAVARHDKKRRSDRLTLVWVEDFGRCVLKNIEMDAYEDLLRLVLP